MLTLEENRLLCDVQHGTPMGDLMRRYWLPAVVPEDVPTPDGPPVRVRLLGENLIAFRTTSGAVGLVQDACPHRGASLFFGRNEEDGLRCVYHGWKFDVGGACTDMPNEPAESNFKHKIHASAYPTLERGGIIWAYLGPLAEQPADLPAFMSNLLPADHVYVTVRVQQSNYLQALEGGYDSSHVGFLHSRLDGPRVDARGAAAMANTQRLMTDKRPRFSVIDTDFGVLIGAQREADEGKSYWRMNLFLMPCYHMSPGGAEGIQRWSAWVPIDNDTTLRWVVAWQADRPITEADLAPYRHPDSAWYLLRPDEYEPAATLPGGRWRTKASATNDYLLDREAQRTKTYTGIPGFLTQDQAVTESMGGTYDRSHEHLGSADLGIIAARRRLARAARALRDEGSAPPGAHEPLAYRVNSGSVVLPKDTDWVRPVMEVVTMGGAK